MIPQILARTGKQRSRGTASIFGGVGDYRTNSGKNGSGLSAHSVKKLIELALKCFQNLRPEQKLLAIQMFLKTNRHSSPADVVGAPRVANHRPKSSGACQFKWRCPS